MQHTGKVFRSIALGVLWSLALAPSAAAAYSFFKTDGRDIVSDSTGEKMFFRGVNLTGLDYGRSGTNPYPGTEGQNYFRPRSQDFSDVRARGFNVVRLPFEWARLVRGWSPSQALPTQLDANYLRTLDDMVSLARANNLYVILDMHDFLKYWSGFNQEQCVDNTATGYRQLLGRTWKLLAQRYANEPVVLGYDIMNEPVRKQTGESCGSCNWSAIVQSVVEAIRDADTKHLIFVEGRNYTLASQWVLENGATPFVQDRNSARTPLSPPRIVYSAHVYFDADNDSDYSEGSQPNTLWQSYAQDRLMPVLQWSVDNNVPVMIGETNVPCSSEWTAVLELVLTRWLDPLHVSVNLWDYIDPVHSGNPLNLLTCGARYQLNEFQQHPGGVYQSNGALVSDPPNSLIYGNARVNPWDVGTGYWGQAVNFCATNPVYDGNCAIQIQQRQWDGLKFSHRHGIDATRFDTLEFQVYFPTTTYNADLYTTRKLSDCESGSEPEYPPSNRPRLQSYLPSPIPVGQWTKMEIPLRDIVDPQNPIVGGLALQKNNTQSDTVYIDRVRLVPSCVIATAAYGSPLAQEVKTLRAFRDQVLLRHPIGRVLVAGYAQVSPPAAAWIAQRPFLKAIIRAALRPAAFLAQRWVSDEEQRR